MPRSWNASSAATVLAMCCAEDPRKKDLTTFHPSGSRIDVRIEDGSTKAPKHAFATEETDR
jgi:hypothetical protein